MDTLVIKISIILCISFILAHSNFGHEQDTITSIYKNDDGTIITTKIFGYGSGHNVGHGEIAMLHDKKGLLISSKHYTWKGRRMLVQTIDDGIVRNIIPGKTRCDFTIIEASGDSIFFHLNPKKKLDTSIKTSMDFISYMNFSPEYKNDKYDAIIYQWHTFCRQ